MPNSYWEYAVEFFRSDLYSCYEIRAHIKPIYGTMFDTKTYSHKVSEQVIMQAKYPEDIWLDVVRRVLDKIRTEMNPPSAMIEDLRQYMIQQIMAGPYDPPQHYISNFRPGSNQPVDTYRDKARSEFEGVEDLDESLWNTWSGLA